MKRELPKGTDTINPQIGQRLRELDSLLVAQGSCAEWWKDLLANLSESPPLREGEGRKGGREGREREGRREGRRKGERGRK
jgi:hypothetical protein